jgi:hypothetical protein
MEGEFSGKESNPKKNLKKQPKSEINDLNYIPKGKQNLWQQHQNEAIPIQIEGELINLGSTSSPVVFFTKVDGQSCFAKEQNITASGYGNIVGQFAAMNALQGVLSIPESRLIRTPSGKIYLLTKAIPQPLQTDSKTSGLASFYYKNYRFFNILLDSTIKDVYNLWESTHRTMSYSEYTKNTRSTYAQKIYKGLNTVYSMFQTEADYKKITKDNYNENQSINGVQYQPLKRQIEIALDFLKLQVNNPILEIVISHGDLNFNNMLSNRKSIYRIQNRDRTKLYKLIDPGVSFEGEAEEIILFELIEEVAKIWISALSIHAPGYKIIHDIDKSSSTTNLYNRPADIFIRPTVSDEVVAESYHIQKWQQIDRTVLMYQNNITISLDIFLDKMQDLMCKLSHFSDEIFNLKYYIFGKLMTLAYLPGTPGFEDSYKNIMNQDNFIAWEAIAIIILENFEKVVGLKVVNEENKQIYKPVKRTKNLIFALPEQINQFFNQDYGFKDMTLD